MIQKYSFDNGKYVIKRIGGASMMAYRHGEFWQNMAGDKLTASMLDEIDNLQKKIVNLEQKSLTRSTQWVKDLSDAK